jgi:transposase
MSLYGGIDLQANNRVAVFLPDQEQVIYQQRWPHALSTMLEALAPYSSEIEGFVVESTYHWYWRVDGWMEAGYRVHLAHPAALQQYSGLKYTHDHSDARWLAHLWRLGVLPQGYISPKAARAGRDLLRKRAPLVRQHPAHVLRVQNILGWHTGARLSLKRLRALTQPELKGWLPAVAPLLAVTSRLAVLDCLSHQIKTLEQTVQKRLKHTPAYMPWLTVDGIGAILAQTIILASGAMGRFPPVGHVASYCRCVESTKLSHGQRKGQGNVKKGHPYWGWA